MLGCEGGLTAWSILGVRLTAGNMQACMHASNILGSLCSKALHLWELVSRQGSGARTQQAGVGGPLAT